MRPCAAHIFTRLIWLALLTALFFADGARSAQAQIAPTTNRVARVLASPAAKKTVASARARQDAAWRAWLPAQVAALCFGLILVARAETSEQQRASETPPTRAATRGADALRTGAQLALLSAFSLPVAALWLNARRSAHTDLSAAQLILAFALAVLAVLCGRIRAHHRETFALFFCSAAGVFTLAFFLLGDAAARYAWTAHRAPAWLLRRGGWLEATSEIAAEQWQGAWRASHLDALNAGFFVAAILVCGVAAVMTAQTARRKVFKNPPLEVRHAHPLSTAWTNETHSQIRLLEWFGMGAILLALRPLGDAPLPAICLTTAAAFMLWGWRHRRLDARRFGGALLGATCAAALLLVLWLASARLDHRFRADAAPREYSRQGNSRRAAGKASSTAKVARRKDGGASQHAVSQPKAPPQVEAFFSDAPKVTALFLWAILLAALLPLLRRPPPILWRVLGNAPAWGWLLLGGVLSAPLLLFSQGIVAFAALLGTLFCAFVFVWLESV